MIRALSYLEFRRNFYFTQFAHQQLRLLTWDSRFFVAVDNERRGIVGRDVVDRRYLSADVEPLLLVRNLDKSIRFLIKFVKVEGCAEAGQFADTECIFARRSVIQ